MLFDNKTLAGIRAVMPQLFPLTCRITLKGTLVTQVPQVITSGRSYIVHCRTEEGFRREEVAVGTEAWMSGKRFSVEASAFTYADDAKGAAIAQISQQGRMLDHTTYIIEAAIAHRIDGKLIDWSLSLKGLG
jgi:hypothetical protein